MCLKPINYEWAYKLMYIHTSLYIFLHKMIIRMKMQNRCVSHFERNSIIMNIIQYSTYLMQVLGVLDYLSVVLLAELLLQLTPDPYQRLTGK